METKRLTEWLSTAEGLGKTIATLVALPFTLWMAVSTALDPVAASLGWQPLVTRLAAGFVLVAIVVLLCVAYRRFATASRIEQPDAFVLHPNAPGALLGRTRDLAELLTTVKRHRLVLLDGESGCGKSALVSAGLIPKLTEDAGSLVPVLVDEWSDDWVRGPLSAALDALFQQVSVAERTRLGWKSAPDLAADAPLLTRELESKLTHLVTRLGRRALVILDQFDDYQVVHRQHFLDADGNWLPPDQLARANGFWGLLSTLLRQDRIHLLVVTRADTAAGLASVRFLSEGETAARTLARVELEYLRPLLAGIAPENGPVIVSHPDQGWHELRDLLERDLKAHGALLMQQVRTVLLGVRQLPFLTPASYLRAGGLPGTETLVVSRALLRAAAVDSHPDGLKAARALLAALVRPGGPNQPPKAGRATLTALIEAAHASADTTLAMLRSLQQEEVIRPVATAASVDVWQLDHDYLARAVLAEARQANRWSVLLCESKARFEEVRGRWRAQWAALLPPFTLFRLLWERAHGRVRFGEARAFALTSALKPGVFALLLAVAAVGAIYWNEDRLLTIRARQIIDRFGGYGEKDAVLEVWYADRALRDRLRQLVYADEGRMERAVRIPWPLADGGFELPLLMAHSTSLQSWFGRELRDDDAGSVGRNIQQVGLRIGSANEGRKIVTSVRTVLAATATDYPSDEYATVYASVAPLLQTPQDIRTELGVLRGIVRRSWDAMNSNNRGFLIGSYEMDLVRAYTLLASRVRGTESIKTELATMRHLFTIDPNFLLVEELAQGYEATVEHVEDVAVAATEASSLRIFAANSVNPEAVLQAYLALRDRLRPDDLVKESRALLALIEQRPRSTFAIRAYVHFVQKLENSEEKKLQAARLLTQTEALRPDLAGWSTSGSAQALGALHQARAALLAPTGDRSDDRAVVELWRKRFELSVDRISLDTLLQESRDLAVHFERSSQAATLAMAIRERSARQRNEDNAALLVSMYQAVIEGITDVTDLRKEAASLQTVLLQATQESMSPVWRKSNLTLAQAYARLATRLPDTTERAGAAELVRTLIDRFDTSYGDDDLIQAYGNLVATLESPDSLRIHLASLRQEMIEKHYLTQWSESYCSVAARMIDPALIANEVQVLEDMLERDPATFDLDTVGPAYAAIAARLPDAKARLRATSKIRSLLEQEINVGTVEALASGYALLARRNLEEEADAAQTKETVRQILTLLGHPFLQNGTPLLSTLTPAAKQDFGSDIAAAVRWAQKTYGFTPEMLRPVSNEASVRARHP